MKLNGWQRLWMVGAVFWLVMVLLMTWILWPTEWAYRVAAPDGHEYVIVGPMWASDDEVRAEVLRQYPQAGMIRATEKAKEWQVSGELLSRSWKDEESQTTLRYAALSWLVPPLVLYACGWAVGWVRRGFRQG